MCGRQRADVEYARLVGQSEVVSVIGASTYHSPGGLLAFRLLKRPPGSTFTYRFFSEEEVGGSGSNRPLHQALVHVRRALMGTGTSMGKGVGICAYMGICDHGPYRHVRM